MVAFLFRSFVIFVARVERMRNPGPAPNWASTRVSLALNPGYALRAYATQRLATRPNDRAANYARRARLCINAAMPNVQGAILSEWLTRLTSAPSFGVFTVTMSPTTGVKPWPL